MSILSILLYAGALFSNSHDVTSLGEWGPYSKQYSGISHVYDVNAGTRFDFTVVPGYYRRTYQVPNVLYESGCYPWDVNKDMTRITYRYELEWKDQVYVDATYYVLNDNNVLVGMKCVNNSPMHQNLSLQGVSSLHYAEQYPALEAKNATLCLYAIKYDTYEPAVKKHNYNLVYDGWLRGEKRDANTLCGSFVQTSGDKGDLLEYTLPSGSHNVLMRCHVAKDRRVVISVNGSEVVVEGTGRFELVPLGQQEGKMSIRTLSEGVLAIDSFLAGEGLEICSRKFVYRPEETGGKNEYILKYEDQPNYYGLAWNYDFSEIRRFDNSELDGFMKKAVHRHPPQYFKGDQKGFYTSAFIRPIFLQPQSDTTVWCLLAQGTKEQVERSLVDFHADEKGIVAKCPASLMNAGPRDILPQGKRHEFSHNIFNATLLTNVVYPVYTQNQYIRHFTPGKNWNSLYTWDLGFISWAFAMNDPVKAFETIRAYTTEDESQSAFIHHGTPLPIQFFAFEQLCSEYWDDEVIKFLYPRLKRFYDYMVGKNPTSTTLMDSGFIRTWDYWYSTGGWDDYPVMHYLRLNQHLYPSVAPMVSSSYYIRAAKILRMIARHYGMKADEKQYDEDIRKFAKPILDYGWDEEAGYFGYVTHDESGKPDGMMMAPDGSNWNMGMDGISPLAAGICTPHQISRMEDNMFALGRLWTPYGMAVVDQSASYYSPDGYSVGASWIPHQLIYWKSMLDYNMTDRAHQIADAVMNQFTMECDATYQSYENTRISTGRSSGWHNFSGLSSPVVNWFYSYYCKGTISTGFDAIVVSKKVASDYSSCEFTLEFDKDAAGREMTVMVCLDPDRQYDVISGGKALKTTSPYPGLVCMTVKADKKPQTIHVRPAPSAAGLN